MRILALIPARGGSKGIVRKNIRSLGGKPLIWHTIESALSAKSIDYVVVSTDDKEIADVSVEGGAQVPFMRPNNLAEDKTPTLPVIIHALDFFEANGDNFDAVCLLQATYPFRAEGFIEKAIDKFEKSNADSLISVVPVPHEYNPEWIFVPDENDNVGVATGREEIISRRQDLPPAYIRDGAIYITKVSVLKEKKSLYGKVVTYIESDLNRYVNLDTEKDWLKAEEILEKIN